MTTPIIYDAFTGIGISKKKAIVGFLSQYSEATWLDKSAINQAVDYAIKEIPSFGGFIVTAEENHQIIAALIVNKTGMQGYMPQNIAVLNAVLPAYKNSTIIKDIKAKAMVLTRGDIAMVVNNKGVKDMEFQNMAVEAKYKQLPLLRKVKKVK